MNTRQENTLSMYYALNDFIAGQQTTVAKLPFFQDLLNKFSTAVEGIKTLRVIQEGDKSGVALDKSALRQQLEMEVSKWSKQLVAWAALSNNQTLLKEAQYAPSDLARATDTTIKDIAELVWMHASTNVVALAPFEVTPEKLTAFKTLIGNYSASISKPKLTLNDRAKATQQIEDLFDLANEQLKLMNKVVEALSDSHPEFYQGYLRANKVVNLGGKKLALRANAYDEKGNPIPNVSVSIVPQRPAVVNAARFESSVANAPLAASPMLTKKTSGKGNFQVQNLPDGAYLALVKKLGFKEQEVPFNVVKGEIVDLKLQLESL